jgi:hypothetical protein
VGGRQSWSRRCRRRARAAACGDRVDLDGVGGLVGLAHGREHLEVELRLGDGGGVGEEAVLAFLQDLREVGDAGVEVGDDAEEDAALALEAAADHDLALQVRAGAEDAGLAGDGGARSR